MWGLASLTYQAHPIDKYLGLVQQVLRFPSEKGNPIDGDQSEMLVLEIFRILFPK